MGLINSLRRDESPAEPSISCRERTPLRSFALVMTGIAVAAIPSNAASEPVLITVDRVVVRLDPDQPVLGCTVVETSGDPAIDDAACEQAREQTGAPLPSMSFQPDASRRFVGCRPLGGIEPTPEFHSRCSAELQRIQRMRAMEPLGMEGWLPSREVASLPVRSGRAVIRIGIDAEGRPAYCLLVEPRNAAAIEQSLCSRMIRRARFRPALDIQGRPMPSVYTFPLAWQGG